MADLAGISAIDVAPAAGFITLTRFPCSDLNSVLRVSRPFSRILLTLPLILLTLPLILLIDFLFPPTHLLSFPGTLMLVSSSLFQRRDLDKATPGEFIFARPPPSRAFGSGNVACWGISLAQIS